MCLIGHDPSGENRTVSEPNIDTLLDKLGEGIASLPSRRDYNRLETALMYIAAAAGEYGDGAPDSHHLAKKMLELESVARAALEQP